jgi:hypothetical protein
MTKFTTQLLAEAAGYVEHIFIDDGSDTKLAAVLYSTLGDCFSYAHFFSEFRRQAPKYYPTVTAAKEDLFAELDRYVEQGMRTAIRF